MDMLEPMTLLALDKRGLILRGKSGSIRLTKAGDLLASLVSEAGYTDTALGLPVRVRQAIQHESMLKQATSMLRRGTRVASVANQLGVSRATMYRHLKQSGAMKGANHSAEK